MCRYRRPKPAVKHPRGQSTSRKVARAGCGIVQSSAATWRTLSVAKKHRRHAQGALLSSLRPYLRNIDQSGDPALKHTLRFCGTGGAPKGSADLKTRHSAGETFIIDEVKNRGLRIGQVLSVLHTEVDSIRATWHLHFGSTDWESRSRGSAVKRVYLPRKSDVHCNSNSLASRSQ